MTDIISRAKRLLENSTPGPWVAADSDIIKESNNEFIGTISEYSGIDFESEESANTRLAAAAPELAALLAEETWEYQVQARSTKRPTWKASTDAALQMWYGYEDVEEAKKHARLYTPTFGPREVEVRVLRRRVSEPEVTE